MTRAENRDMMTAHIERWRNSGQTQKDYCRSEGLSLSKFHYWVKQNRISEAGISGDFIELNSWITTQGITIRYPDGKEITLPVQTSIKHIKELLSF
jgi:hypothetical protein